MAWTPELEAAARKLYEEGSSASATAAAMWTDHHFSISRNAIIGKAHRDGWDKSMHRSQVKSKPHTVRPAYPPNKKFYFRNDGASPHLSRIEPETISSPDSDLQIPVEQRRTLLELRPHDCRWPVGMPGTADFFFCASLSIPDGPYCAEHAARAFVPRHR